MNQMSDDELRLVAGVAGEVPGVAEATAPVAGVPEPMDEDLLTLRRASYRHLRTWRPNDNLPPHAA